jgi:steroid delta-isomerase-like uncharacterized protein
MSHNHSDHIGCQWFERVWNARNPDAMIELAGPDMRAHGADGQTRTMGQFQEFYYFLTGAVPDLHVDVENCVRGANTVAVQWRVTGTHSGLVVDLPPTGNRLDARGLSLMRIEGDRVVEGWDSYDFAGVMRQLGAPAPAP